MNQRPITMTLFAVSMFAQKAPSPPDVPQWQIAAGDKMAFEVASVKPTSGPYHSSGYALDSGNLYRSNGGRFSAAFPVLSYIAFAYKVILAPSERRGVLAALPKWVGTDAFEITARAPISDPTKDQIRLMVQSLLAERFGLVLHFETQLRPVLALEVTKAGSLGPKLRLHSEGPPCPGDSIAGAITDGAQNAFPATCGAYLVDVKASGNGIMRMGARDTTMELFAGMLPTMGNSDTISLPVVDHTG